MTNYLLVFKTRQVKVEIYFWHRGQVKMDTGSNWIRIHERNQHNSCPLHRCASANGGK